MASVGVAVCATMVRPIRRRLSGSRFGFTQKEMLYDSLSALAIVPFALILGSAFSTTLMGEAMKYNSDLMAVGGFWGLLFVIGDLLSVSGGTKT